MTAATDSKIVAAFRNGNSGWVKFILSILIPLVVGAVGFGVIQEKAHNNENRITRLEERMDAKFDRIDDKLDLLLRETR